MSKGFKIKRNNSRIYRRDRSKSRSPLSIVAMVAVVAGLFVLGWFVYPPVYDLITGQASTPKPPDSQSEAPLPSEIPESSAAEPEPVPEPEPEALRMIYAPTAVIMDAARLEALAGQAQAAGCNALLFDVKDNTGKVLYRTANAAAIECGAVAANPFDIKELGVTLKKYGLKPVARLHTLKDHIFSAKNMNTAVHYQNTNGLWLDNYANMGGKPWLNPYSTGAQDYNIALARECAEAGVEMVIADSVQFPNVAGAQLATYGDTQGVTWEQALAAFVVKLEEAVTEKGARFAVATPATALTEGYAGMECFGKPAQYQGLLAVNAMPAFWARQSPLPNEAPVQRPGETLRATLKPIQQLKPELIPFVQCYTDGNVAANKNKQYTKLEIEEQLAVLKELAIESYLLYSPDGVYPL